MSMYYNNHRSRKEKNETTEKRGEVGSMRPPQDLSFRFGDTPASPRPAIQAGLLRKKGPLALQLFQTSGVRFPVRGIQSICNSRRASCVVREAPNLASASLFCCHCKAESARKTACRRAHEESLSLSKETSAREREIDARESSREGGLP